MRFNKKPLVLLAAALACGMAFAKSPAASKAGAAEITNAEPKIAVSGPDKIWLQTIIKAEPSGVAAIVALKALLPQSFHVFATKSIDLGLVVTWDQGTTQRALEQIMGQLRAYYVLPGDGSFTVYPGKQPIAKTTAPKKVKIEPEEAPIDQEQLQINKELIEKIRGRLNAP